MNKLIILVFTFFVTINTIAQKIEEIPTEKEVFVKTLVKLIDDTKRTELKDLTKNFSKGVKDGVYSDDFVQKVAEVTNKIIVLRGRPYPHLSDILNTFIQMNSLELDPSIWNSWNETLNKHIDNTKKGELKNVNSFLKFSYPLFKDKILNFSKSKTWYFEADNFELKHTDKGPIVELGMSQLFGYTKGDTLSIQNTVGHYNFIDRKWYGLHGAVNWERAGISRKEVFCTFNNYKINMDLQSYVVDSVMFTYKNYFNKDIKGRLEDKLIADNNPGDTNFPKFTAKREDVPAQIITENVIYEGTFTLAGSKIIGKGLGKGADDVKSQLTIYKPGTKELVAKALFYNITINKPEKVSASNAEVSLYVGNDSIYHPRISLQFNLLENKLRLVRGEGSLARSKFLDSYHKVDFDADVIEWDITKDYIDINTVSTSGLKASTYESFDFFNKGKIRDIRGNVSYDPLSILNIYRLQTGQDEILDEDFAKRISPNLTVKQIQTIIFKLVTEGFVSWNRETGMIAIKHKVKHYVMSNADKKDYDNILLISKTKKQNGRYNLNSRNITLEGIRSVPLSVSTMTELFPDSSRLVLKKNRDMEFNGFFFCGRLDFFGRDNEFIYDEFKLKVPKVDTMIINIPDGDDFDQQGNPYLKPLNTVIENISGEIEINDPENKSGKVKKGEYPKLHSKSNSRIFFESKNIRDATYKREEFYYILRPFTLDSMLNLKPGNLDFEGELHSAGIFPVIKQNINVQSDLSLGFRLETPTNGYDLYGGRSKFFSTLTLNGKGLSGEGLIQFKTVSFESSNIEFFPDSLLATTDTLGVEKSKGTYETPWVRSSDNDVKFYPKSDSLWASSSVESPFKMYGEIMDLDGTFSITGKGVSGTGTADWDEATLISDNFRFAADEMYADTAELIIKSLDGEKVTFNTPNVNAAVDFIKKTGYFKSNTDENRTEFGNNQYETDIDEFFWDIDNKKLEFNAKEGSKGATFRSLHKDQDSLSFLVKKADFNLQTSIIEANGVEEILVADSRVIPENGKVTINPAAKLNVFENAIIEANAISKKHRIEKATVDIFGKNAIKAKGDYAYKTKDTEMQYINFPDIKIVLADSSVITKRRKKQEKVFAINGKGIVDQTEDFVLYPNVTFYGDVQMFSTYDKLKVKGFTKIDFKSDFVTSDFYEIDSEVDPENLQMDVSQAKDPGGALIKTGIFVSKSGIKPIYTEILNNQIGPIDIPMIETEGILAHNYEKDSYIFGSQEKIDNPDKIQPGNTIEFTPSTGAIHAEGLLDLGTQYGVVKEKVSGFVDANLNDDEYSFNTTISFPFKWDKDLLSKMGYYLVEDNFDVEESDYSQEHSMLQLSEHFNAKEFKKISKELEETGFFTKPKTYKENLLLSDVKLYYDNVSRSYKSKGSFNLSLIGEKAVHKKSGGYIELGHRMGSDYFRIYLKTSLGDWIYIFFDGGATNIQVISSYSSINDIISGLDIKKRIVKGEEKDQFIIYEQGSSEQAIQFAKRMKEFAAE